MSTRWLRSAAAFVIGLTGTLAVSSAALVDQDEADELGPVDLFAYCERTFGSRSIAVVVENTAFGWRCVTTVNDLLSVQPVDLMDACEQQYGRAARAITVDEGEPYSWRCVTR